MDTSTIIFDVETTGTDRAKDEVIELAIQFGFPEIAPNGAQLAPPRMVWRFKPTRPVGASVAKHRITDEMLINEQPFRVFVQRIGEIFDEAEILIAYNGQFDIDMLMAEFARARYSFPSLAGKVVVDPLRLWQSREPRTLEAAHRRFVGGDFKNAHSASADVLATGGVLLGMIRDFGLGDLTWAEISVLADPERLTWLGPSSHFRWIDGTPTINFGNKCKGMAVADPAAQSYLKWILRSDFQAHVKEIAREATTRTAASFVAWAAKKYPPPAEPTP